MVSLGIKELSSFSLDNSTIVHKLSAENTFAVLMAIQLLFSATHILSYNISVKEILVFREMPLVVMEVKKSKPQLSSHWWEKILLVY